MLKVRTVLALAIGAGAAYFGDRSQGRRRRTKAKSQLQAWTNRRRRNAERAARYEEGVKAGEAARARGAGRYHPHSDTDLHEHLRMVLANLHVPTSAVTVEVVEGLVRLRGQVEEPAHATSVVSAVRAVPGVAEVESLLHLPGEPAPNKAAALAASGARTTSPPPPGATAEGSTPVSSAPRNFRSGTFTEVAPNHNGG
ncbi:MAG: BON domain-containing protein [Acidimicrobiia bacterium]|nr:BON domain-containing protein [Acidimicrobiia bacterium]